MKTTLLLDIAADAAEDRLAVDGVSFGELRRRARGAAWLFSGLGVEQVAYLGTNGWILPALLFGSGYAGLPFCPLNFRTPDDQLNRLVARTAPSLLVVDDDMAHRIRPLAGVRVMTRGAVEESLRVDRAESGFEERDNDVAVLLFTSGTTGDPKVAVLRHENLVSYVMGTVEFLGAGEDEAALVSVPAYHIAAISAVLTGIYGARRIVYLPSFDADQWVAAADAGRVTHAMVVPTMLERILAAAEARGTRLASLRALSYGGGRMPAPVIERAVASLPNVDFVNAYGLTETSSTVALLTASDHRAAFASADPVVRRRLSSVGRPLPDVEIQIRDDSGDAALPAGRKGEIYVRGPQVAGEYLGRKLCDDDGWFATNDAGWFDEDGYLFVDGRLDDVIVRGGENISPGEIEDCLRLHDAVADVAVIGLPSVEWGEKIAAALVLRSGASEADLAAHVRDRLRSTKTPEAWFFVQELPYNETGKLLRRALRSRFVGEPSAR